MSNILDLRFPNNCGCSCGESDCNDCGSYKYQRIELTALPILGIQYGVTNLQIDFIDQTSIIDLTNALPTNMCVGARLIVRKLNNKPFDIQYNDGQVNYVFINQYSEYIELYFNGTNWHI